MREGEPRVEDNEQQENLGLYAVEIKRAQQVWGRIFDSNEDGQGRVDGILANMDTMLNYKGIDGESIRQEIRKLADEENKEAFIGGLMKALDPIIELSRSNPRQLEAMQRELMQETENKIANEVLYYDIRKDRVNIHILPSKTLGILKIKQAVLDGLRHVAKDVEENPNITRVEAESWIIYKNPKLVENLGFKVVKLDEEEKVGRATISREEFLGKYYK